MSAWQGMGAWCAICETQVRHDEIEFELEFGPAEDDPHTGSCHVHSKCFEAWELERHNGEAAVGVPDESARPRLATQSVSQGEDTVTTTLLRYAEDLSAAKPDGTMMSNEWDPKHRGGGA
jgi:hypothetical protein